MKLAPERFEAHLELAGLKVRARARSQGAPRPRRERGWVTPVPRAAGLTGREGEGVRKSHGGRAACVGPAAPRRARRAQRAGRPACMALSLSLCGTPGRHRAQRGADAGGAPQILALNARNLLKWEVIKVRACPQTPPPTPPGPPRFRTSARLLPPPPPC